MSDPTRPLSTDDLIKLAAGRTAEKLAKRGIRCLWLAVALTAAGIVLADWRWRLLALAGLAAAVGIGYLWGAGQQHKPDVHARMAKQIRDQLQDKP